MKPYTCAFCGYLDTHAKALAPSEVNPSIGICKSCARRAVRWHGEIPDPNPARILSLSEARTRLHRRARR